MVCFSPMSVCGLVSQRDHKNFGTDFHDLGCRIGLSPEKTLLTLDEGSDKGTDLGFFLLLTGEPMVWMAECYLRLHIYVFPVNTVR